jgi:hypothetical protein
MQRFQNIVKSVLLNLLLLTGEACWMNYYLLMYIVYTVLYLALLMGTIECCQLSLYPTSTQTRTFWRHEHEAQTMFTS